jgi:peptidoglycan/LPS O-acetylase OafA/YrhL
MGLIRFLLAMSVVVGHMRRGTAISLIPGPLAVEVFFSISGFYMSLILTRKYRDRTTFYVNRFLRLYPVYFAVSLCTWAWLFFVWMYLGRPPSQAWPDAYQQMSRWQSVLFVISNWTMVGLDIPMLLQFSADNGFTLLHDPLPDGTKYVAAVLTILPAWSIGLEIWFYLIAPFLVALRSRWIVLIAALSVSLRIVTMTKFGFVTSFFFPAQLCFFLVGMLLHRAYAATSIGNLDRRVGCAVLTVALALFVLFNRIPAPFATYVIYGTFIPAIPILFALTRNSRFDVSLGNLSYPIFIVHTLILSMVSSMFHHVYGDVNRNIIALVAIGVVVVVSAILYFLIEKPIDEIRQRRAADIASPQLEDFQSLNMARHSG